jgi:hypothetical protein
MMMKITMMRMMKIMKMMKRMRTKRMKKVPMMKLEASNLDLNQRIPISVAKRSMLKSLNLHQLKNLE